MVREQFFTLSAIYPVYKQIYIEPEYGYVYYHHFGVGVGYRFVQDNFTPYLITGFLINKENFPNNTFYKDASLKFGVGIEAVLSKHFFINIESTVLNYLTINYSLRKIKFREIYDFGNSIDYSVSIGVGYRFEF